MERELIWEEDMCTVYHLLWWEALGLPGGEFEPGSEKVQFCLLDAGRLGQLKRFQKSCPFHAVCLGLTSLGKELDWHLTCLCRLGFSQPDNTIPYQGSFKCWSLGQNMQRNLTVPVLLLANPVGQLQDTFRNQTWYTLACSVWSIADG